ncbi:MAG: hypothetical protein LUD17_04420 [Bacteroidales bacterium]|nr:hypothetical protein [Bacteroidales bacterium]
MEDLNYKLLKISLKEFAIIDAPSIISEGAEISINVGCKFALDKTQHNVLCTLNVEYRLLQMPLLKALIEVVFNLTSCSYDKLKEGDKIVMPQPLLLSFASTSYSTLRGILFAKTEDTIFNTLYLPLIDMSNIVKSDLSFT